MRHPILASLLLLSASALTATAQTTASTEAGVRAAVANRPLSIIASGFTDFGSVIGSDVVAGGGTASISPDSPGAGQTTAMYSIFGEPNTVVFVSCGPERDLFMSTDVTQSIRFFPRVAESRDPANQSGAFTACLANGTFTPMLLDSGEWHLWLGGDLVVGTHNPPNAGVYTNTYTITVAY